VQGRCQRLLQGHVAAGGAVLAEHVGQGVRQDLPQPAGSLDVGRTAALGLVLVGLQQRLLDHVTRVQLGPQPWAEMQPGQQAEVIAVVFQPGTVGRGVVGHAASPGIDGSGARIDRAQWPGLCGSSR
jgi:hypothetical protein